MPRDRGRVICVEPDEEHFQALVESYRGIPNVFCENSAISDRSGPATFYRLGVDPIEHGFPAWLSQLGSLKKDRMGALWDGYEEDQRAKEFYLANRVEETIDCITFDQLATKYGLASVDLLQIDVEGYEMEILKTIDFLKIPARFVNYESVLLHGHTGEVEQLMRRQGYKLIYHGQDTFCYRPADRALTLE